MIISYGEENDKKCYILYLFTASCCSMVLGSVLSHNEDCDENCTLCDWLALLVEYQTNVREVVGSNPGRTNTQGL